LQNRLIQTSQTGGQQYSDTSPFSIPWIFISGFRCFHCLFCLEAELLLKLLQKPLNWYLLS
jgi:hypothetical protein